MFIKFPHGRFAQLAVLAVVFTGLVGCGPTHFVSPTPPASPPNKSDSNPANHTPSGPWTDPVDPTPWTPPAEPWTPPPPPSQPKTLAGKTIVVDAGHGGKDPGTQQLSPVAEKHITLAIAKEVERGLKSRGAKVHMTRAGDTYPSLGERAALADRLRADVLVSIHADSAETKSANGPAVWVARSAFQRSVRLAEAVLAAFKKEGLSVRGLRRADFQVLVKHSRPAMLVECGFLTNAADAKKLNESAYQRKIAEAIVEGIAVGM